MRGAFEKRAQIDALHFVAALHLAHEQLGIAEDAQARQFVAGGVIERGDQAVVFGDVIRFAAQILAEFKDALAIRRFDNHRV